MRTTVRLNDALLEQAKREAARTNKTLTALIEQGLRVVLAQSTPRYRPKPKVKLPVCRRGGGTLPGVDLDNTSSVLDIMDGRG